MYRSLYSSSRLEASGYEIVGLWMSVVGKSGNQIWWSPKCHFSVFCMIPSEKGLVFGEFWYVSSQKIQKNPFFFFSRLRLCQASE
jgi:hypothetical protein